MHVIIAFLQRGILDVNEKVVDAGLLQDYTLLQYCIMSLVGLKGARDRRYTAMMDLLHCLLGHSMLDVNARTERGYTAARLCLEDCSGSLFEAYKLILKRDDVDVTLVASFEEQLGQFPSLLSSGAAI